MTAATSTAPDPAALHIAALAEAVDAAELEAAQVTGLTVDPALLGEALRAAAGVYTAAALGDTAGAGASYADALLAAGRAFTPGSQLGRALAVVLARVARQNGIRAAHRRPEKTP